MLSSVGGVIARGPFTVTLAVDSVAFPPLDFGEAFPFDGFFF